MDSSGITRSASHAGSWYTNNKSELDTELTNYLKKAEKTIPEGHLKGIISPHAGLYYSGPTAAWSYINVDPSKYSRVFLLGPAHHTYLDGCALSQCSEYDTPLGSIKIDVDTVKELHDTGEFKWFSLNDDEEEHSLEMHLPYIKKIFTGDDDQGTSSLYLQLLQPIHIGIFEIVWKLGFIYENLIFTHDIMKEL